MKQLKDDWPPKAFNDPKLDTGHYDDGHAFGWNVKKPEQEAKVIVDLVADVKAAEDQRMLAAAVKHLETNIGVDLDGDGQVGGAEQRIDTQVGPPQITNP